ncbi:MAG: arylamine N-acetyltransferase [Acidobacteriota bacterium]
MNPHLPIDEILEALDLSRAEPGPGLLEALFARFNARVPFETASKIERDAEVADPEEKPRRPDLFWREHLQSGSGGTCFARVAAFDALLAALGFPTRKILGRVQRDFDHAAQIIELAGRSWICDVGFPFPALLPAEAGQVDTSAGPIRVRPTERGLSVDLGGVPEGPRRAELFLEPVAEETFARRWRETYRPGSKFLSSVSLRLQRENRAVSFAAGEVRVDDAHSRLTVPLRTARPARLSEIFGVDAGLLARAFERVGDPGPSSGDASLTAYLETQCDPGQAFSAIASPAGYRRLLEGVAAVSSEEATEDGWTLRLSPPAPGPAGNDGGFEERVRLDAARRRLEVTRLAGQTRFESFFRAERRGEKSYLLRGARLQGPREDLLRNDSLRGRLAAGLAVDLLAWERKISP